MTLRYFHRETGKNRHVPILLQKVPVKKYRNTKVPSYVYKPSTTACDANSDYDKCMVYDQTLIRKIMQYMRNNKRSVTFHVNASWIAYILTGKLLQSVFSFIL